MGVDNETCHAEIYIDISRWIADHLVLMFGIFIVIAGVVTSLLSFAMFTWDRLTPKTTRFMLKTLSIADALFLILACVYVQMGLLKSYASRSGDNITAAYIARVYNSYFYKYPALFGLQVMEMFRNWITVLIGIERFIVVCWPLQAHQLCAKRRFVVATFVVFLSSVCARCPLLLSAIMIGKTADPVNSSFPTTEEIEKERVVNLLGNWHDIVGVAFVMVLPQLILLICTVNIIHNLRRSWTYSMGNCSKASSDYRKRNLKVTRMLLTVIIIFSVCTLPAIVALVSRFTYTCAGKKVYYMLKFLFMLFSLIFSASNFFVYIVFMRRYREILRSMFNRRWRQAHRSSGTCTVHSAKENENSTWL